MSEMPSLDLEKHARERWWHEDNLINQRTTWLLTTQGILSGAFAFVKYRVAEISDGRKFTELTVNKQRYIEILNQLATGAFAIGLVSSIVSLVGIFAAVQAQRALAEQYPFVLSVTPKTTRMGQFVACFTPLLCAVAWVGAFSLFTGNVR